MLSSPPYLPQRCASGDISGEREILIRFGDPSGDPWGDPSGHPRGHPSGDPTGVSDGDTARRHELVRYHGIFAAGGAYFRWRLVGRTIPVDLVPTATVTYRTNVSV